MIEKIYFVAGEASGDNHGAALLQALRARVPQMQFAGRGGPKMRALAGGEFRDWIDDAAVVGLWEVIKHYGFFRAQFRHTITEIGSANVGAVVLIDYPGFNLRLARALRAKFPALKIIYYISPQVWAWNRSRIKKMGRWLDLMLCIFPFEPELYNASGLYAVFVGHPMKSALLGVDELGRARLRRAGEREFDGSAERCPTDLEFPPARNDKLIGIFPGSRQREVRKIFPVMRNAARILLQQHSDLRFEIAAASERLAEMIRAELEAAADDRGYSARDKFVVRVGDARGLMRRAQVGMVASGTATLESALARLPFVLVYRVSWLTYFAARLVVKVKFLGMPNVLAGREIVPEFIQHRAQPRQIASAVSRLLAEGEARAQMLRDFDEVADKLGEGEASANAADAIVHELRTNRVG
ncbi:MAG: lipid-A-disaccharide synthase [Verrucomicrobiota bacterium]|nr:lipid-A-disaccharide synthase [Verrucomicrobiota bacterium]